jgi:hypothetical protein
MRRWCYLFWSNKEGVLHGNKNIGVGGHLPTLLELRGVQEYKRVTGLPRNLLALLDREIGVPRLSVSL